MSNLVRMARKVQKKQAEHEQGSDVLQKGVSYISGIFRNLATRPHRADVLQQHVMDELPRNVHTLYSYLQKTFALHERDRTAGKPASPKVILGDIHTFEEELLPRVLAALPSGTAPKMFGGKGPFTGKDLEYLKREGMETLVKGIRASKRPCNVKAAASASANLSAPAC